MINFVIENDWKWNHCKLPIKRSEKRNKRKEQEYFYQVMNSEDTGPINQDRIRIVLDRPFPFEPDTGFVWHKSWNLPEITVQINEQEMSYYNQQYKEVACEVMAVYPVKYSNTYYLNQVSLEGNCLRQISQHQVTFKFLKFGQTSFNHARNKFCLLIWVYGENAYKDKDDLFCLISSPIYVDSRKQARKKEIQTSSNIVANSPKKFTAPIGGIKGSISNSSQGFINYYSAQNIRNKIKHPYYIAYHFDKLFKLYINLQSKMTLANALGMIQSARFSEPNIKQQQSALTLQIFEPNQKYRKKIISILEKWKFGLIQYMYLGNSAISTKWGQVSKEEIKLAYRSYYENQMLKEESQGNKKEVNVDQNISSKSKQIRINKNAAESEEKSSQYEKQKTYELRTIIDLSRPRKKTRVQQE